MQFTQTFHHHPQSPHQFPAKWLPTLIFFSPSQYNRNQAHLLSLPRKTLFFRAISLHIPLYRSRYSTHRQRPISLHPIRPFPKQFSRHPSLPERPPYLNSSRAQPRTNAFSSIPTQFLRHPLHFYPRIFIDRKISASRTPPTKFRRTQKLSA